jgi:hypothetical protein
MKNKVIELFEKFAKDFDLEKALNEAFKEKPIITIFEDKTNKNLPIVIKRDNVEIGKISRFNNGLTKDGFPLPLE